MEVAFKHTSHIPGPVIALLSMSLLAWWLKWPVETIGSRFGGIPQALPAFAWPHFSWESVKQLFTPTLTIALLGAIESLLCARVADQLGHLPAHDPNQELMAQGIANIVVPFFGGMPVTGTIARTVTNLRAGAKSPIAGILHAAILLAIVLLAAPLALHVPLAVLAGILLFVAWNMGEWREFARLRHFSNHYRVMLLSAFIITVVFDLTVALEVGMVLACVLFVKRMSSLFSVEMSVDLQEGEASWNVKLYGVLFFGAVTQLDPILHRLEQASQGMDLHIDAAQLIALDTTGLDALRSLAEVVQARQGRLHFQHLNPQPLSLMQRSGFLQEIA